MKKVIFALSIVAVGMLASCGGNSGSEATAPADSTAAATETVTVDSALSTQADTSAATTDTTAAK